MNKTFNNGKIILTDTSLTVNVFIGGQTTVNRNQIILINYVGDSFAFRNFLCYLFGVINLLLIFNFYLGIMQLKGYIKVIASIKNGGEVIFYIPGIEIDDFKKNI